MEEIGSAYENSSGILVIFNFDGTQVLRTQVEEGAYADVFVSANNKHMDILQAEELMIDDTIQIFTRNSLAIIVPKENPAGILNLTDLARPKVKIVMGTKEVPVGSYALELLDNLANDSAFGPEYREQVLSNVVSYETNVNYVVSKVALGEADCGFVYKSDVTPGFAPRISKIEIPEEYNVMAEYSIGVMSQSEVPESAKDFIGFVRSPEGMTILEKHGFEPVDSSTLEEIGEEAFLCAKASGSA
jgi:molybdate transport system substrate-binding protein